MSSPAFCSSCLRSPNEGEPAFQHCAGCKSRHYCSKDCQRAHWKGHKKECKTLAANREGSNIDASSTATASTDTVQAVRLCCSMEPGTFWPESIPSNHPIFNNPVLPVPARVGIPLVIHRLGTKSRNRSDLDCQIATYLNIDIDTGLAPSQWQSQVGSCIVARKDKKPLSVEHLEVVWMYIDSLLDLFGEDEPEVVTQRYMSRTKVEEFEKLYKRNQLLKKHARVGWEAWENVGSVYDV